MVSWRALAALLLLAPAVRAAPVDAPPPTKGGIYVTEGCPFEGCTYDYIWRATKRQPLYAKPGSQQVVGWVKQKDSVEPVGGEIHLVPRRGVLRKGDETFKKGDVVYLLDNTGEGFANAWRRGKISAWFVPADKDVAWDKPSPRLPKPVWWVKVRQRNKALGWLRDPAEFECADQFAGDADCVKVKR